MTPTTFRPLLLMCILSSACGLSESQLGGAQLASSEDPLRPDRAPPSVVISAPASGSTVSGLIYVKGTASDNRAVARVEVQFDGNPYQLASGTSTWSLPLDTTALADGAHTVRARAIDAAGNIGSATVDVTVSNAPPPPPPAGPTPYLGHPVDLPGTVEAEDFDLGGEGVAYHDTDAVNQGGQYRPNEGVDIKACSDTGGGYAIGWVMAPGEWLLYTVNVTATGSYDVSVRVASAYDGRALHLELDGADLTGAMSVPNTGGFDGAWATVTRMGLTLAAGTHRLKVVADTDLFDLSSITVAASGTPPPPPPPPPPTCSGIAVAPGDDVQAKVNAASDGATFCLAPGTYRMVRVQPKNGQSFIGQPGTVFTGARVLTGFSRENSLYVATGQTQEGQVTGECLPGFDRCANPEDLFFDDVPLIHVSSLSAVGPGTWFFDYAADKIYFSDDPTGHRVETSVTRTAFYGPAGDVQLRGLTVEKYASPAQMGAIGDQYPGPRWIIDGCEVRLNHGPGVTMGPGATLRSSFIHHNGQLGVGGSTGAMLVENNEIAHNRTLPFDWGWEGGGTKWAKTDGLVVRGNYSHHNHGPGLWTDIDNIRTTYENNTVEDNDGPGIFHEISYSAVIRNNTLRRNGQENGGWIWNAGIQIAASADVEVYGNTLEGNRHGIAAIQQNRGSGAYGAHLVQNLDVHDNTVTQSSGTVAGAVQDVSDTAVFTSRNNRFQANHYSTGGLARPFTWMNGDRSFTEWRGYGLDTTGTFQ